MSYAFCRSLTTGSHRILFPAHHRDDFSLTCTTALHHAWVRRAPVQSTWSHLIESRTSPHCFALDPPARSTTSLHSRKPVRSTNLGPGLYACKLAQTFFPLTLVFTQHKSATMREFFSRFRPQADTIEMHNAESVISASDIRHIDHENTKHHNRGATPNSIAQTTPTQGFDSDEEMIHRDAQAGVQKIEAITKVWSKKHMIAAYVM